MMSQYRRKMNAPSIALRAFGALLASAFACSSGNEILVGYNLDGATGGISTRSSVPAGGRFGESSRSDLVAGHLGASTQSNVAGASSSGVFNTSPQACDQGGPPITLPPLGGCTTDLAKRIFLFAICTCSDFEAGGGITTNPFGTSVVDFDQGASIGVNGHYQAEGVSSKLGGSLWVSGNADFGQHEIWGELQCGGTVSVSSVSTVHRDALVLGALAAPELTIGGTLRVTEGAQIAVGSVGNETQRVTTSAIPKPCNCGAPVDVASVARYFATDNDDARASLNASSLAEVHGALERTVGCGRYYFDDLSGTGSVTLHLTGKTLLAVGGEFSNSGGLSIDLGPAAELDLFIAGNLELSGPLSIGDPNRPAATRIYVAGQAAFSSDLKLYANLYIPNSLLAMSAPSEFWGALFSQSLSASAGLSVHYDESVLALPSCTPPGQSCSSCRDCANPTAACNAGRCEPCQRDSDCCPPLYCNQGVCQTAPVLF